MPIGPRRALGNSQSDETNAVKADTFQQVFCAPERGGTTRGVCPLPGGAHCRSTTGDRQSGNGGQRTTFGPDALAAGAHVGPERSAQHSHRTENFP